MIRNLPIALLRIFLKFSKMTPFYDSTHFMTDFQKTNGFFLLVL